LKFWLEVLDDVRKLVSILISEAKFPLQSNGLNTTQSISRNLNSTLYINTVRATQYSITIISSTPVGSSRSRVLDVTTLGTLAILPQLVVSQVLPVNTTLQWGATPDTGGSAVTYVLQWSLVSELYGASAGATRSPVFVDAYAGPGLSHTQDQLYPSSIYRFRLGESFFLCVCVCVCVSSLCKRIHTVLVFLCYWR
jgi:hypothetical protein